MRLKPMVSRLSRSLALRSKLRLHAAEADGISKMVSSCSPRSKLRLHAAEADGIAMLALQPSGKILTVSLIMRSALTTAPFEPLA
jgi:hypothetical protein